MQSYRDVLNTIEIGICMTAFGSSIAQEILIQKRYLSQETGYNDHVMRLMRDWHAKPLCKGGKVRCLECLAWLAGVIPPKVGVSQYMFMISGQNSGRKWLGVDTDLSLCNAVSCNDRVKILPS